MLFNYYARSFFLGKVIENRVGFAQALLLRCFYSFGLNQGESPWPYFRAAHSLPASICIREHVYLRVCLCVCVSHSRIAKKKLALSRRRRQRQRQRQKRERKNEKQRQRRRYSTVAAFAAAATAAAAGIVEGHDFRHLYG